jgi:hypothetical protein
MINDVLIIENPVLRAKIRKIERFQCGVLLSG